MRNVKYPEKPVAAHPLFCWDIASEAWFRKKSAYDIRQFEQVLKKHRWKLDMEIIRKRQFDAIVVTDPMQKIVWVSTGFKSMTGYSVREVVGRKPSFLHGPETTSAEREQIRNAVARKGNDIVTITNYKKQGTEYFCQVELFPLVSEQHELTHFLALEKEIQRTWL